MDWNINLKHLVGEATQLVRQGQLADATRVIQQTLGAAVARHSSPDSSVAPAHTAAVARPHPVVGPPVAGHAPLRRRASTPADVEDAMVVERTPPTAPRPTRPHPAASNPLAEPAGSFTRVALTYPGAGHNPHHYHLYVPPGATAGTPMPLVLMLHGCTQNPVDFATGTGMNAAATPANALVLYPEQPHSANPNGCWNWFRPSDQHRGSGEPALLVAMVRDVMARHPVDVQRVYVAGLSAGGAMAAVLAQQYPEVFAAVGVHSGLPAGAVHTTMGALSAMKSGAKGWTAQSARRGHHAVPMIVLHGDADATVHQRNGEQLLDSSGRADGAGTTVQTQEQGVSADGQRYTRTCVIDVAAQRSGAGPAAVLAEHWLLHGAGHAWSGGDARGTYANPQGVDASAQMMRFFLAHPGGHGPQGAGPKA